MVLRASQVLAIVLTAIALGPALALLFELPNKIGLREEDYFLAKGSIAVGRYSASC